MRNQMNIESFLEFLLKKYNGNIENEIAEEVLGSKVKARYVYPVDDENIPYYLPRELKMVELENGDVYKQVYSTMVNDNQETSLTDIRWEKMEAKSDEGEK